MTETLAPLATPRLQGDVLSQDHFAELHQLHTDPLFMKFLGGVKTQEQTQEYLDKNLAHWLQRGFGIWLLRSSETGELVGRAGLRTLELEDTTEVEIGYGLRPQFWGRGLATEVARECLRIAADSLARETIVATTYADHVASRRVMERVGMRFQREVQLYGITLDLFRIQIDSPSNSRVQRTPLRGAADAQGR